MKPTITTLLFSALCTLWLVGCVTKPAPDTRFYILTGTAPAQSARDPGGKVLEIASLSLPQYLDRPELVTRPTPQRLEIHENHRWGDNLRKNLERLLAHNLSAQTGFTDVLVVPHLVPKVDYRLLVEIQQFERVQGDRVMLLANWTLLRSGKGKPLAVETTRLQQALPPGAGMDEVVEAMSLLFAELGAQIAKTVVD